MADQTQRREDYRVEGRRVGNTQPDAAQMHEKRTFSFKIPDFWLSMKKIGICAPWSLPHAEVAGPSRGGTFRGASASPAAGARCSLAPSAAEAERPWPWFNCTASLVRVLGVTACS